MSIDVMKQALEALVWEAEGWEDVPPITRDAITALRAAIEQVQEPEKCHCDSPTWCKHYNKCNRKMLGLPPAPRQWQGLTEIEFRMLYVNTPDYKTLWEAIEAKLRERNT